MPLRPYLTQAGMFYENFYLNSWDEELSLWYSYVH